MTASTQTTMAGKAGHAGPAAGLVSPAVGTAAAAARIIATEMARASSPRRACPKGYTPVERSLWRQMTESTGADICDSGGAYGRGWERNRRAHDLKARPFATIDLDFGPDSPDVSVSTFHRLSEELGCAPGMNRRLARFNRQFDPDNVRSWLDVSEAFAEKVGRDVGYYLSYNDEYSVIDQVVQFVSFTDDGSGAEYVLLQVHGGCDVRAGYSKPVAYEVSEIDPFVSTLQEWSASCQCTDGCGNALRLDMRMGEFTPDGLDKWPKRWAVSGEDGTARCGKCGEGVLVS